MGDELTATPLRRLEDGMTREAILARNTALREQITRERREELDARDRALDQKLDDHKDEIKRTLDDRLRPLEEMRNNVAVLVGTPEQPGSIAQLVETAKETNAIAKSNAASQESLAKRHDLWHEEDLEFRAEVRQDIQNVDAASVQRHEDVMTQLYMLSWLISTARIVVLVGQGVLNAMAKGRDVWTVCCSVLLAWVAVMQWIHSNSPRAYTWTLQHNRVVLCTGIVLLSSAIIATLVGRTPPQKEKANASKPDGPGERGKAE